MNKNVYKAHKEQLLRACEQSQANYLSHKSITPFVHVYKRYMDESNKKHISIKKWIKCLALDPISFEKIKIFDDDNNQIHITNKNYWNRMSRVMHNEFNKILYSGGSL